MQVLLALERLNANLERYLDVTIPAVVAIAEQEDAGIEARVAAIHWIARTCRRLNVLEFASRIVHPLARLLDLRRQLPAPPTLRLEVDRQPVELGVGLGRARVLGIFGLRLGEAPLRLRLQLERLQLALELLDSLLEPQQLLLLRLSARTTTAISSCASISAVVVRRKRRRKRRCE